MFNKILHFIKFNNAAVIIIIVVFTASTSVFASETGQELIGEKQTNIEGVDNSLLIDADLDNFDMEFKIEKIEEDEDMYYITYTYLDLVEYNNAWQYQLKEKTRKVSKKLKGDLGLYLAQELEEEYQARVKELNAKQDEEEKDGEEKRVEVTEYSGLIGGVLDVAAKVFSGYEPVKRIELASPATISSLTAIKNSLEEENLSTPADDLTQVYNNYIEKNDPDEDNVFGVNDNCPSIYNPNQLDSDGDNVGDLCDIDNINSTATEINEDSGSTAGISEGDIETVEIVELPGFIVEESDVDLDSSQSEDFSNEEGQEEEAGAKEDLGEEIQSNSTPEAINDSTSETVEESENEEIIESLPKEEASATPVENSADSVSEVSGEANSQSDPGEESQAESSEEAPTSDSTE